MKKFFKVLLAPTMSLEEKLDELYNLPDEDLNFLMEEFTADEEFELCHAIQIVIDDRKNGTNRSEALSF